jgi:glycine/D-amino acid oxidase-like deaminating enzyme
VSGGGILDPVKLVEGLQAEAERLGVRVFENTEVRVLESAGGFNPVLGPFEHGNIVLATSAYTHHLLPRRGPSRRPSMPGAAGPSLTLGMRVYRYRSARPNASSRTSSEKSTSAALMQSGG